MDCLSVLRDYAMRGKLEQVSITDTDVLFGDGQRFPRDTKTAYKSNQGKGEYYQLDILVYYMQNVDTPNYIANARAANMRTVMFLDRKDLAAYLLGQTDASDYIIIADGALLDTEPTAKRQRVDEGGDAPDVGVKELLAQQEQQLRTRNTMLIVPGKSFKGVFSVLEDVLTSTRTSGAAKHQNGTKAPAPQPRNAPQRTAEAQAKTILLAPGTVALLNMYNAPQFFAGQGFRSWEDMHRDGARKQAAVMIDLMGNPYLLTDKLPKGPEWKSVVAVVVNGKPWQFKDYPFKGAKDGDLVDTLHHMLGVYFHYKDEAVPKEVKTWNVKTLGLHRHNRHQDADVHREFYTLLQRFEQSKGGDGRGR